MISLEREDQVVAMLRYETGEGNCQVETHADLTATLILEVVDQLLIVDVPGERLKILQDRGVDRFEAMPLKHIPESRDHQLPKPHLLRKKVTKTPEDLRILHALIPYLRIGNFQLDDTNAATDGPTSTDRPTLTATA
jgi:hypothetical protein